MISIIIIVKNDRKIENTLNALKIIDKPEPIEIIVVDATINNTLDDIKDTHGEVQWLKYKNSIQSKRYTIPEQRNEGIKAATGEIIVFTDASCVPEKYWLINLLNPLYTENEIITVGSFKSLGNPTLNDLLSERNAHKKYVDEYPTINMAFKNELINAIGYFDERFDYGSDMDFTWRVRNAGYKIRYVHTALIWHDWGSVKDEFNRTILYGEARARLYLKHKNRWKNLVFQDPLTFIYPILILSLPLTLFIPIYPVVFLVLIIKNIKEPKPIHIVVKHVLFGLGVLKEMGRSLLKL